MIGDGAGAGGRRPGLVAIRGCATRRLVLVAEDPRQVGGAAGPFGEPQHEVVIVGAVVAVPEAAGSVGDGAAGDDEAVDVVLGAQPLRREVRLERRRDADAVGVDDVVVAVGDVDIARGEDGVHRRQRVGLEHVAVVKDGDQLAGRRGQSVTPGGDSAAAALATEHPHARVGRGRLGEHRGDPRVGGAVVDDHVLPAGERLRPHRFEARPEVGGLGVADGRQNGEARTSRRSPCGSADAGPGRPADRPARRRVRRAR